jgi:hypothetical protein
MHTSAAVVIQTVQRVDRKLSMQALFKKFLRCLVLLIRHGLKDGPLESFKLQSVASPLANARVLGRRNEGVASLDH